MERWSLKARGSDGIYISSDVLSACFFLNVTSQTHPKLSLQLYCAHLQETLFQNTCNDEVLISNDQLHISFSYDLHLYI